MFGWGKKEKKTTITAEKPAAAQPKEAEEKEGLKVKVTDRQACAAVLSVEIAPTRVDQATQESFRRIQGKARVPGFRPGKAPLDLIQKNYKATAREDALDRLLRETVWQALEKESIVPVVSPTIDKIQYDNGKPLTFELKVESAPQVSLRTYKGLALEKAVKTVTDEEVQKKLDEIRETNAKLVESKEDKIAAYHFVGVDYVGTVDGLSVEGGRAENQMIDMSAQQNIAGFTEGLLGAKLGEQREVPVKFPDDHPNKELAGKQLLFKITVNAIKEKQFPALDDEFAKDVGCQNLNDLQSRIRRNLENEAARALRDNLEKQVSDRLLETHTFEVPPSLVEERARSLTEHLKQFLVRQGAREDDWKANEEKMLSKNKAEAERQIRLSYVLSKIAQSEKIEVTDEDVNDIVQKSTDGQDPRKQKEMRQWMDSRKDGLKSQIREERIFSFLIDNANVTEVPAGTG